MPSTTLDLFGTGHVCNPELIKSARAQLRKTAFVPGGDPSAQGGGGGGAPPMDPAAMGGGGGAPPPMDPAAGGGGGGGGGGDPLSGIMAMMQQMQQQIQTMSQGGGGGAGGAAGGLKPKIDVNVELMQIKNLLAKLCDQAGIQVPAQDMVATQDKLNAMANGQSTSSGAQPGGAAGGAGGGAIGGIDPMQGMAPAGMPGGGVPGQKAASVGMAFDTSGLGAVRNRAAAIAGIRRQQRVA